MVHASVVVAATAVAFAVVVGVIAWIATHPGKGKGQVASTLPLAPLPSPAASVEEPQVPLPMIRPAARPIVTIPAVHRPQREEILVNRIPLAEETPPPLLPRQPRCVQPPVAEASPAQPAGETYGTQVLFLNNPAAAKETARREKKMLFVMHISGNFEDSCFT